jgi:hypothetical protein
LLELQPGASRHKKIVLCFRHSRITGNSKPYDEAYDTAVRFPKATLLP